MAGFYIDDVHVYEMVNLSSGDKEDHMFEKTTKNKELSYDYVYSDGKEDHMFEKTTKNKELSYHYVYSDGKEDHMFEKTTKNKELSYDYVGSPEKASVRTTQSSTLANVMGSVGEYHMYDTVNENIETSCNNVGSDKNIVSGVHALQAHNGSANTCMNKRYKILSITLVVMAVAVAVTVTLVVFFPRRTQATNSFCNVDSDCKATSNSVCSGSPTTCTCKPGYKTSSDQKSCTKVLTNLCTQDSECSAVANSRCSRSSNKTCACKPGYKESSDQLSCDKALTSACTLNSDCSAVSNSVCSGTSSMTCTCKPGYKPSSDQLSCEKVLTSACTLTSDCSAVSNSACSGTSNKTCICKPGYKPSSDQLLCDTVLTSACTRNSDCSAVSNSACSGTSSNTCTCKPGYKPSSDQLSCDTVLTSACTLNSDCSAVSNSACGGTSSMTCTCKPGYKPSSYQLSFLTSACTLNSDCSAVSNSACIGMTSKTCTCKPGYKLSSDQLSCDTDINQCASSPCLNGATCVDGINIYACKCELGYVGTNCENNINVCASSPCMHGAQCVDGINKYTCICKNGYSGINCQIGSLGTTKCMGNTDLINGDIRTCGEVWRESTCVQGKCACSASYVPTLNNTACEQGYLGRTYCSTSSVRSYTRTCEQVFGAGTTCTQGQCLCSAAGYVPNLTVTACVRVNGVQGRTPSKSLVVTNGDDYPDSVWGNVAYCPPGTFATGYRMKIEQYQGIGGDDTFLNAIQLVCSDLVGVVRGQQVTSLEGPWGVWTPEEPCPKGTYLVSFKLQVQSYQGSDWDDTSVNYVKFYCRDFAGKNIHTELVLSPGYGSRGVWGSWSQTCDLYSAICGLKTKVERDQRDGDDTALNDVEFYCCNQLY